MTIEYKAIKRGRPGVPGGGEKKYYAAVKSGEVLDLYDLARIIQRRSSLGTADIIRVVYSLTDAMKEVLSAGNIVQLGALGNFRISIRSHDEKTAQRVNRKTIKQTKIVYLPGKKMKEMLVTLDFKKVR